MTLKRIICAQAFAGLIFLYCAGSSWGQTSQSASGSDGQEIKVTADSLAVGDGGTQIEAKGNVEIQREQTKLKAEEVRVNRETQDVEAKGNVSLESPEWKLKSAESVQMNMGKETGEIKTGDIFIEQGHISITGERFEKFGGQTYHVDEGFFTTCLCESGPPSWKFSAKEMDLDNEGMGTVKEGVFYIMDIPVFYLPYGFFPLKTERQTGFLFPRFGQSSDEGFRFQQPFFWAISKSTDATFNLDVQTDARIGMLGEFRTIFNRESHAELQASYFNENLRKNAQDDIVDRTIADLEIPKDRWSIIGNHRYTMPSNWLIYSEFAAYSDDLFTREIAERFDLTFGKEGDLRRSRFGRSRFGFFRSWGDTQLQGDWNFYQDFIQADKTTLHRTPQISFWGRRFAKKLPLELRWRAEGVNYLRRKGGDGLRLDLRPELTLPFRMSSYLFGSFSVAPRETIYHLYETVKSSDRNLSRELVEIRGNVGTSVSRIFSLNGSRLNALNHVIEPEIDYLFIPRSDQSRIPIMDGIDRVRRRNVLTFALNNRIWGRFGDPLAKVVPEDKDVELLNPVLGGQLRELGSLRLALSYDVDKERKGGDSLSDLDFNLRLRPTSYLNLGFQGGLNPGPWQVTQARATFGLSDPRPLTRLVMDPDFMRRNSFNLSYQFLRRGPNSILAEDANIDLDADLTSLKLGAFNAYCAKHPLDPRCGGAFDKNTVGSVGGNLLYHVTDHLLFYLAASYNIRDTRFPGYRGAIKILSQCECWTLTFSLAHAINPAKTTFNFDFNLLGLGAQKSTLR